MASTALLVEFSWNDDLGVAFVSMEVMPLKAHTEGLEALLSPTGRAVGAVVLVTVYHHLGAHRLRKRVQQGMSVHVVPGGLSPRDEV